MTREEAARQWSSHPACVPATSPCVLCGETKSGPVAPMFFAKVGNAPGVLCLACIRFLERWTTREKAKKRIALWEAATGRTVKPTSLAAIKRARKAAKEAA